MTEEINFNDWQKLDLRVAEIIEIKDIENADKLYEIKIDLGELGKKTICAGIKLYYSKKELLNKKIIVFTNLAPRKLKGIESQGMLLAADEQGKPTLLTPEKLVKNGAKIR